MRKSVIYFTGLILSILGIIGIFNAIGTFFLRIFVLALGIVLLTVFFIIRKRN